MSSKAVNDEYICNYIHSFNHFLLYSKTFRIK